MATSFPISEATGGKGAQGELLASAWLIGLGYEVFRNVSYFGPADLIAWKAETGEMHLIDVKTIAERTIYRRGDGSYGIPIGSKGRPEVHKLLVVGGKVVGFCRSREKTSEFYWPLTCSEMPVELSACSYKEMVANRPSRYVMR